jgi:hypothetical protein
MLFLTFYCCCGPVVESLSAPSVSTVFGVSSVAGVLRLFLPGVSGIVDISSVGGVSAVAVAPFCY